MQTQSIDIVTSSNVNEVSPHHFVCDASDLGIAVGEVPKSLATCMGNGQPFQLVFAFSSRFEYKQGNGSLTLTVFND